MYLLAYNSQPELTRYPDLPAVHRAISQATVMGRTMKGIKVYEVSDGSQDKQMRKVAITTG